ncbi:hypothetical protein [Botrimarina mediterranea]|uniref:hypothetical protein n=1 Tax=Botrimarina mediterranea TaxID=2528022 RepID=UPI001188472D|nr:Aldose 1-epimerase [Planctomycetes bacterium K2D]
MSASLQRIRCESWDAYELANDTLRVVVVPALGGKIVSLSSRRSGREWLWRNPHLSLRTPATDASDYSAHDFGGWDEVFPSVSPCEQAGTAWGDSTTSDHGELWRRPWSVVDESVNEDGSVSLSLSCELTEFGVTFTRRLTLAADAGRLLCDYTAENRASLPAPFIWAAHPLIAIRPSDAWSLPTGTRMKLGVALGIDAAPPGTEFEWPLLPLRTGENFDLRVVPDADAGYALKLFALKTPTMSLQSDNVDRLTLSLEGVAPNFALWLNYGGWSGADCPPYYNAGFEPTNVAYDSLADATRDSQAAVLTTGETQHWRLVVEAT